MIRRRVTWLVVYTAGAALMVWLYSQVVAERGNSSQAAELAVVVEGIDPANGAGLRVDVVMDARVRTTGCARDVPVTAIISGTPAFWKANAAKLRGTHRVGIGLRTSYDHGSVRFADWSGYELPRDLVNITSDRVQHPDHDRRITLAKGQDRKTGVTWYVATIRDWGAHWTPLALEFTARLTAAKALGSCYLVLPGLVGVDTTTVDDASAAAAGADSVFSQSRAARKRGAVTFGRVVVHTNGRVLKDESRPNPQVLDGNPWVSGLGEIGEEAAIWTCRAGARRADWPVLGTPSPGGKEIALRPDETENPTCDGLAVIEARAAPTVRDLGLLVIGGLFALLLEEVVRGAGALVQRLDRRIEARRG
jgi:hypothetical protein